MGSSIESILEDTDDNTLLSELIKSDLQMDRLLLESDNVLSTAESDLKATEEEKNISTNNNPTLLIDDISGDLYKALISESNFSKSPAIKKKLLNETQSSISKDNSINEVMNDFDESFQLFNNTTLTNSSKNMNKIFFSTPLAVQKYSKTNEIQTSISYDHKNLNKVMDKFYEPLKTYNTVFDVSGCEILDDNDVTIVNTPDNSIKNQNKLLIDVEQVSTNNSVKNQSKIVDHKGSNDCEDDVELLIENHIPRMKPLKCISHEYNCNFESNINNLKCHVKLSSETNKNISNPGQQSLVDEQFKQKSIYQKPQAVDKPLETGKSCDVTELNTLKGDNQNVATEEQNILLVKQDKLTIKQINITKHDNTVIDLCTPTKNNDNTVKVQKENNASSAIIEHNQNLKRKSNVLASSENCKQSKLLTAKAIILKRNHKQETEHDEGNLSQLQNTIDGNFTRAIFDPNETADNMDPGWNGLKDLSTSENYFQSVRDQWKSLSMPNPHRDITRRFVNYNLVKNKQDQHGFQELDRAISCDKFIDNRIKNFSNRLTSLKNQSNNLYCSPGSRTQRKQINRHIEQLQLSIRNLEKNREEVKQINSFYHDQSKLWDANFLTTTQLGEVEKQDNLLEFQMKFYQSY